MIVRKRDLIAYLAVKENGDWDRIYERLNNRDYPDPSKVREVVDNIKSKFTVMGDEDYPSQLLQVYKPPFVLFYYGDISWTHIPLFRPIAIIGSRKCSEYGIKATEQIASEIANDFPILSGLALGIDGVAHETAIRCGGKTIAVLGTALDYCYPSENLPLYKKIKESHLLISEYPEGSTPPENSFPLRNRIIAGLADSVVVTEAGRRSGTSITVNFALTLGKNVLCVPYPIGSDSTCNRLIKEGAYLVENGKDVRELLTAFCQ